MRNDALQLVRAETSAAIALALPAESQSAPLQRGAIQLADHKNQSRKNASFAHSNRILQFQTSLPAPSETRPPKHWTVGFSARWLPWRMKIVSCSHYDTSQLTPLPREYAFFSQPVRFTWAWQRLPHRGGSSIWSGGHSLADASHRSQRRGDLTQKT